MVFQLSQEGALPDWKRQMLARILKGRDVVVMGYSGLDFDICPILFGLEYKRLFWLFAESNDLEVAIAGASPNVQNVHGEESRFARVFGVLGGFDVFFGEVAHRFNMSTRATSIADELF
ncbi:MAG TPA: hypothetical protein EYQ31_08725, partial [Candidatus Handelsmanbacteria bacterium]|nr:hypothetical protein [Candidatus Handelsmanbacteria bacterium]